MRTYMYMQVHVCACICAYMYIHLCSCGGQGGGALTQRFGDALEGRLVLAGVVLEGRAAQNVYVHTCQCTYGVCTSVCACLFLYACGQILDGPRARMPPATCRVIKLDDDGDRDALLPRHVHSC